MSRYQIIIIQFLLPFQPNELGRSGKKSFSVSFTDILNKFVVSQKNIHEISLYAILLPPFLLCHQVVFTALLAVAAAAPGLLSAPYGAAIASPYAAPIVSPWGHGLVGAPVVKAAVPVATSYANTVRVSSLTRNIYVYLNTISHLYTEEIKVIIKYYNHRIT